MTAPCRLWIAPTLLALFITAPLVAQQQPQDTTRRRQQPQGRISTDQNEAAVARVDNLPLDAEARGFVALTGTNWRLRIGGYAKTDVMFDTRPAGLSDLFVTSSIPTGDPPAGESSDFNMHVRQTRLSLELRRPSALGGDLRAYFEGDLFGPNNTTAPNLRHAYIQAANVLVGRTFTTFMDVDALPDGVDFEGPSSTVFAFSAQVRYTKPFGPRWSVAVAAEQPIAELSGLPPGATAATRWPDMVVRPRYEAPWGHVQFSAIVRDLGYNDGVAGSNHTVGYGLQASSQLRLTPRDNLFAAGIYGRGYARFIVDFGGLGLDAALDGTGDLKSIPTYGYYGSLQHLLTTRHRLVATGSWLREEPTSSVPVNLSERTLYGALSFIWTPWPTVDIGFTGLYGENHTISGAVGHAWRFQSALQLYLVK